MKKANTKKRSKKFSKLTKSVAGKAWLPLLAIAAVATLLFVVYNVVIAPRIATWVASKFPVLSTTKAALEAAYPDKDIFVIDQTVHDVEGKPAGKHRILAVSIIGKSHITRDEALKAREVVCAALGDKWKNYDTIMLDSVAEKRFLVFFSNKHKMDEIACNINPKAQPAAPAPAPAPATPQPSTNGNFQPLPGPDMPTSLGNGNFQLQPVDTEYPDEFKKNFIAECTAAGTKNGDPCSCALGSLISSYSYSRAIDMINNGISQELKGQWQEGCYLPAYGFDYGDVKAP